MACGLADWHGPVSIVPRAAETLCVGKGDIERDERRSERIAEQVTPFALTFHSEECLAELRERLGKMCHQDLFDKRDVDP